MRMRSQCGHLDDWLYADTVKAAHVQDFGDRTSLVNALRNRRIYANASLRLLADLVEVMRGTVKRPAGPGESRRRAPAALAPDGSMLEADFRLVERAAQSSACLFASLLLKRKLANLKPGLAVHTVLLCAQDELDVPLDALAHLLAAAIARQFDEVAAAVTFPKQRATVDIWCGAQH